MAVRSHNLLPFTAFCAATIWLPVAAAKGNLDGFDDFMVKAMPEFKMPWGLVVTDAKFIAAKGSGYRDVAHQLPVAGATLFPIASIDKSFTVTAVGTLADQRKLDWDKPVCEYLTGFRMYDGVATERLTTCGTVTHPIELARNDLASSFKRDWLRYLEPSKPLRSKFQYNKLMFETADYFAGRINWTSWKELVRQRVLKPEVACAYHIWNQRPKGIGNLSGSAPPSGSSKPPKIHSKSAPGSPDTAFDARNSLDGVRSRAACSCDIKNGRRCSWPAWIANIAHRTRSYLEWNGRKRFTDNEPANRYLPYKYRLAVQAGIAL